MRIALCQIDTILGDLNKNLSKVNHYIDKAVYEKCELAIFPELALTGYNLRDLTDSVGLDINGEKIGKLKEKSYEIDIVLGYVEQKEGYFYNSAVYISNGEILHNHRKKFLPDYGMFEEERYFTRGSSIKAFDTKFGKTTLFICEDSFHISSQNDAFKQGTNFLIILSASPFWMNHESIKPQLWKSVCLNFSQFSNSYAAFVNRTGFEDGVGFFGGSFLMNPFGSVIDEAALFKEEFLIAEFDKNQINKAKIMMPILKNEDKEYANE